MPLAPVVDEIINENLKMRPSRATEAGEHRWDGELDDLTPEGLAAEARRLAAAVSRLEAAENADGGAALDVRIDAAVVRNALEKDLFSLTEEREPARNPLLYSSLLGDSLHGLLARPFAPIEQRLASLASRLAHVPAALDAARKNLEDPPEIHVRTAAAQLRGLADMITGDVLAAARDTSEARTVGTAAESAVAALLRFAGWLDDEVKPRARADGQGWRLGPEKFARKLRLAHDDPSVTPEGLVSLARAAHRTVRAEMAELAGQLHAHVASGCAHEGDEAGLVRCVLDALAKEHPAPGELLAEARATSAELLEFLNGAHILPMPDPARAPLAIEWLPRFASGVAVAMLYPPGPLEKPGQPAYYYIMQLGELTPAEAESFLREYNRHMLVVLSIHEALPGHYVQLAWSNACRSRARSIYYSGVFVEGWAKYTEKMTLEAGFLAGDPIRAAKVALQQRKIHLRAVTNTILDVEMHAGAMDERAALELMIKDSFQEEREARGKYDRARMTSTQLTTYFAGDTALWALRHAAERQHGARFSLHAFHEQVMAHGSPAPRHVHALMGLP